jgi:DNA-binding SARP family transcriptional activator/tetratricopeptide (TPR) repeat protein
MSVLEVRVLGPFAVLRAGQPIAVGRSKRRDLLALLAAHSPAVVPADVIVDELWHGSAPSSARKIVQKHISELRHLIGRAHLVSLGEGYALRSAGVDSAMFEAAFEAARFEQPPAIRDRLTDALALWRGEPYADVDLDGLVASRARLVEMRLAAFELLNEARLTLGDHLSLIADLERLTIDHPLREALWSQLIRAFDRAGRQGEALRAFQRMRSILAQELGIEPSGELRQLEQQILVGEPDTPRTSPDVAAEIDSALRRVITIIAVELGDPAEDDPEDRVLSMKAVHAQIHDWCEAAQGTVESSMGSRLLIAFGAPAHEDDADRAVHLANHLVARLPSAKASLATGWALVQRDAAPGAHIVGSVVEVACAGLAAASPGVARVHPSTAAARSRPIAEHPFVGRERELSIAGSMLARTIDGHGPQAINIRGEPGVGKSRLVHEMRRRSSGGTRWLYVSCSERAAPSSPMGAVVRAHIGLPDTAAEPDWIEAFDTLLGTLVADAAEREWLRRRLGPAAGIGEPSVVERSEIVAAWVTYLAALAHDLPTVIVFDDVHRTDPAFDGLLTDCCTQLADVALMIISTTRPDHRDGAFQWVGGDNLTLTLRGLDAVETDALLDHLLADDPVTESQRAAVRTRSAGIPLYAIQFSRMLRQEGWGGAIPPSTRSLIAARLDLLAPLQRAMLFAGSVADQPFCSGQLAAMQGVDEGATALALRHLVDKGFVVSSARGEMSIAHDLVREVACEHLSRSARARLHEAAARWLERHAGHRLADDAMSIAHHLAAAASAREEDGEDSTELRHDSFRMMIVAGDRLRGLGVDATADPLAEEVRDDLSTADVAELHRQRAAVLARAGRLGEAATVASLGLAAARQVDDRSLQARLSAMVGEVRWLSGHTAACVEAHEEALSLVEGLPMDRAAAEALASLAFVTALLGRPTEAIVLAERGLALARELGMADKEVRCLNARGAALLLRGDLEGYNDFMRALARALEAGLSHESAMAYHNLAELQLQGTGPATSLEMNQRGLDLAQRRGLTLAADWLRANRLQVCFDAGLWDEALTLADQVLASEAQSGHGQPGTSALVWSARIHLWRGDVERARRLMDEFMPRARHHAVIQQRGPALIVAAMVETAAGRADVGAAHIEEYCELTRGVEAYRYMELADLVRVLVVAGRADRAAAVCGHEVIQTLRNQGHVRTAEAWVARADGRQDADGLFRQSASLWRAFGQPLEEHLALMSIETSQRETAESERAIHLAHGLGLAREAVAALCPMPEARRR